VHRIAARERHFGHLLRRLAFPDDAREVLLGLAGCVLPVRAGHEPAGEAEEYFTRVVREGQAPEEVPEVALPSGDPVHLPALLVGSLGVASTSEARRLIAQGGVKLDGEAVGELDLPRERLVGAQIQVGKRRYATLTEG